MFPILAKVPAVFQHLTALIQQRLEESKSTGSHNGVRDQADQRGSRHSRPASKSVMSCNETPDGLVKSAGLRMGSESLLRTSSKGVLLWDRETENAVIIDSNTNTTAG